MPALENVQNTRNGAKNTLNIFLQKSPKGNIVSGDTVLLTDNTLLHAGLYDFEALDTDGGEQVVYARFSFLW